MSESQLSESQLLQEQPTPPAFVDKDVNKDINEKIRTKSATLGGNSQLCMPVYGRLAALFELVRAKTPEERAPVEAKFLDTVAKFLMLLRVHNHYNFLLFWLANSQRLVDQVSQAHTRIDEIYAGLDVQEDKALADWRETIKADRAEQTRWFVDTFNAWSDAMLVNEVPNPSKLKETLTMLKNQLSLRYSGADQTQDRPTAEMASLMSETLDRVTNFTEIHLGEAFLWYVPYDDIKREHGKETKPFREGTFGQLYKGTWTDEWSGTERTVAIKQLFGQMNGLDDDAKFSRELATWSQLRHENILELLGANHVTRNKFFISEYATEGNFVNFFTQGDDNNRKLLWSLFIQVATGLQFLHDNKVEHGGLKTTNLLVTRPDPDDEGRLVAKVSDFGMATVRTQSVSVSIHAKSEMVRWKAPECLVQSKRPVDFGRSDTYSLGLCVYDAASGEVPYGLLDDDSIITSKLNFEPIERPDGAFTDEEWGLVASMIDNNPGNRPTLDVVIQRMRELDAIRQQLWPFDEPVKVCPSCSNQVSPLYHFCGKCGGPITRSAILAWAA